jgi:hypothetical protein
MILVSKKLTSHYWQWYSDLAIRQKIVTVHEVYIYTHTHTHTYIHILYYLYYTYWILL